MIDRKIVELWRQDLLRAWANNHRALMTALLEDGPQYNDPANDGPEVGLIQEWLNDERYPKV